MRRVATPSHLLLSRRLGVGTIGITVAALAVAGVAGCSNYTPTEDTTPSERVITPTETETASGDMLVRVSGTVVTGDGPNCVLLDTGTTRYALVGGDPNLLAPDEEVTVTGTASQSTPTSCAEGVPLTVTAVEPLV